MSSVHLHLLLSHVPVIGMIGVAFLLFVALVRRSDDVARVALAVAVVVAISAAAVFLTGEGSEDALERVAGVSEAAIETHEEAGAIALWSAVGVGAIALGLLALFRKRPVARAAAAVMLFLALTSSGIFAWTANLGGQIRHTEISGSTTVPVPERNDDR